MRHTARWGLCLGVVLSTRMFYNNGQALYPCCLILEAAAPCEFHSQSGGTEELNFSFYLILMNSNLHSHRWVGATLLDCTALELQLVESYSDKSSQRYLPLSNVPFALIKSMLGLA